MAQTHAGTGPRRHGTRIGEFSEALMALYLYIPVFFIVLFLGLLLAIVVLEFFPRRRFVTPCLLAAALTSIPGFLLGCAATAAILRWQSQTDLFAVFPKQLAETIGLTVSLSPFALCAAGALLGFFGGAWAKYKHQHQGWGGSQAL